MQPRLASIYLLLILGSVALPAAAQSCSSLATYCETYVCTQNKARQTTIIDEFGMKGLAQCNKQQALGSKKNTCTIGGQTVLVGSRMAPIACTPEKIPPAQRALVAPVPATVRAYSNARQTVDQAITNETKAYIQRNPSVCGGLSQAACQSFVKRTIVTQPDYTPIVRPIPKLTDVLAKQLITQGVYKSETYAKAAAQRIANSGLPSMARGDPHMVGWDGTPFEFMGWDEGVFNLVSERRHQVNALLRSYPQPESSPSNPINTTWITAVSARFTTDFFLQLELLVDDAYQLDRQHDEDGNVRVYPPTDAQYVRLTVNGDDWSSRIRTEYSEELYVTEDDDVLVYLPSATKGGVESHDGALVVLTTPDLELVLSLEGEGVLHLDVQARMRSAELAMLDGVLGQTVLWQLPGVEKQLATPDVDFEVADGLSGVDCRTCTFSARMTPQQIAQLRRRLMAQ